MSNVSPIREGYDAAVAELRVALAEDDRRREEKFMAYAEENGFRLTDADGNRLTSSEVAWESLKDAGLVGPNGESLVGRTHLRAV